MILLRNLTLARAGRPLVEGASLGLHAGWKVGLTGANGSGKSSLFALFSGELHQEAGDLELPPQWVIAHVGQETPALPDAAIEFVLDGDAELRRIEAALREAEEKHDGEAIAHLHMDYGHIDGYSSRARAAALLHGLGFRDEEFDKPVAEFSGGWRVRLNLARALMCRSDLLLLDEPTNHLDLDAVIWLEKWLGAYRGTLLMISHDRDFLDAVVGHVIHIEGRRLFEVLDRRLAEHEYLAGDYSIADIANWAWVRTYRWSGISLESLPHLERWKSQLSERSSHQRGIERPPSPIKPGAAGKDAEKFAEEARRMVETGRARD